jgi:SAM-dependent methyltransferase
MMPETHSNTITEIRASEAICPVCQTKSQMMLAKTVSRPDNLICPACGLVFQPRETESQAKLAACYEGDGYWNASTVKLSRYTRISVLDDIRRGRPRLKMIEKLLGRRLGQTDRVLDIGCGYGGLLWQIRRRGITKVTGLEPSPVCSQAAQSLLGLDIHCKMFEETDCSIPGGYSLITSLHTLEHVSDPIDLLRRAGELLAAEGRL